VGVVDLVELDGCWAVVMELADGLDLHTILSHGPVPPRAALQIVAEIASALHSMWIVEDGGLPLHLVHRDLKPSNLVITRDGEVRILDFGLAVSQIVEREARTATDMVAGTLRYMSPERFEGAVDGPADIYSLGVILLDMFRLHLRVSGFCTADELEARLSPALEKLEKAAGWEVAALARRLLAHDPMMRPTAIEVSRECRRLAPLAEGPDLVDWALADVAELADQVTERLVDVSLVGSTLSAGAQVHRSAEPEAPASLPLALLAVPVVVAFLVVGLVAGTFVVGGLAGVGMATLNPAQTVQLDGVDPVLEGLASGAMPSGISADGRTVAFARDGKLYRQVLGEEPVQVEVEGKVLEALIHPDGARIAYRDEKGVVLAGDGAPRRLMADAYLEGWGPDGERLLLLRPDGEEALEAGSGGLVDIDLRTGEQIRFPGDRYLAGRYLDDGTVVAATGAGLVHLEGREVLPLDQRVDRFTVVDDIVVATVFDGVRSRLFTRRLDTAPVDALTFDRAVFRLGPASDGQVLFHDTEKVARARLLDLTGRRVVGERIVPLDSRVQSAFLHPDGKRVSAMTPEADVRPGHELEVRERLRMVDLDGKVVESLGTVPLRDWLPAGLSRDGLVRWVIDRTPDGAGILKGVSVERSSPPDVKASFDLNRVVDIWMDPDGRRVAAGDTAGSLFVAPVAEPLDLGAPLPVQDRRILGWTHDGRLFLLDDRETLALLGPP
ncbi:MAG: serine/threonine protein kinase, partial [Myxococcales bacterium]|nr:serine/threonine protein kinase [Myxococcales bacterium]